MFNLDINNLNFDFLQLEKISKIFAIKENNYIFLSD